MKHVARRRLLAVRESEVRIQATDHIDFPQEQESSLAGENVFSSKNASMVLFSMVSHITDICSSASVCYLLFLENKFWWFILMTIPLVASLVVVNAFSLKWYWHDRKEYKMLLEDVPKTHWFMRIFFHVTLLGPVIRYLELYLYGLHSLDTKDPKREAYKVLVLQEERDISFLALVGSFVKSAPQLVLEIYILLQNEILICPNTAHAQDVSVVVAVANLSLAMMSYHRALRRSSPTKLDMTTAGSGLQFVSHFFIIGCRVATLAAFASAYHHWLLIFLLFHWLAMVMWLIFMDTRFCSTEDGERRTGEEILFNAVMAVIYIFCFMNVKDEPTRYKYAFYYSLMGVENLVLVILWYFETTNDILIKISVLASVVIGFMFGLAVLRLYYRYLHPNKVSRLTTFIQAPVPVDFVASSEQSNSFNK